MNAFRMPAGITGFACALLVATFVSPLAFAKPFAASATGPSAEGKFEIFAAEGAPPRSFEFKAEIGVDGRITGEVIFQDNGGDTTRPEPGEPRSAEERPLYLRAELDCLLVEKNKAVMSGSITHASLDKYLGGRFLLAVQDNAGEDLRTRDKVTWGLYRPVTRTWQTTDAERPETSGPLSWIVTDAERPEDSGSLPETDPVVGCRTFPISAFTFLKAEQGSGNVHVRP